MSRALLGDGRGPAEVIASLDRCATTFHAMACATVVYAVVDLTQHTSPTRTGHPRRCSAPSLMSHEWRARGRAGRASPGTLSGTG